MDLTVQFARVHSGVNAFFILKLQRVATSDLFDRAGRSRRVRIYSMAFAWQADSNHTGWPAITYDERPRLTPVH